MARTFLDPVTKTMGTSLIGGFGGRTRRECWSARSLAGIWGYERCEGGGTMWFLIHLPTGWVITGGYGTLTDARTAVADASALLDLWLDAQRELLLRDDGEPVSNHDRARAVLTWMADNAPAALARAERRAEARRLLELAVRVAHVATDLRNRIDVGRERDQNRLAALLVRYNALHSDLLNRRADLLEPRRQAGAAHKFS